MKSLAIASLLLFLSGCASADDDKDPRYMAVYQAVHVKLGDEYNDTRMEIEGLYGPEIKREILAQNDQINKMRVWAEKLQDRTIRGYYLHWLDYYSRGNEEGLQEWQTHKGLNEFVATKKRWKAEFEASHEASRSIPKPP